MGSLGLSSSAKAHSTEQEGGDEGVAKRREGGEHWIWGLEARALSYGSGRVSLCTIRK